jgi:exosome complex RNA-binding protein Rrp42 (RNase PH superfamily)
VFSIFAKKPLIELPESVEKSSILTAQEKMLLSSVNAVPVVDPSFEDDKLKNIFQYYSITPDQMDVEVQKYASELLQQQRIQEAWQVLLLADVI